MRERVQHYDRLDATAVLATVERLQRRIAARFPERNLSRVAEELQAVVADVTERAESPDLLLRWLRVASRVALFGDRTTDSAVLDTVSDVESLTDNMSTKIWQKVALLPLDDSWRRPGPIPGPAS